MATTFPFHACSSHHFQGGSCNFMWPVRVMHPQLVIQIPCIALFFLALVPFISSSGDNLWHNCINSWACTCHWQKQHDASCGTLCMDGFLLKRLLALVPPVICIMPRKLRLVRCDNFQCCETNNKKRRCLVCYGHCEACKSALLFCCQLGVSTGCVFLLLFRVGLRLGKVHCVTACAARVVPVPWVDWRLTVGPCSTTRHTSHVPKLGLQQLVTVATGKKGCQHMLKQLVSLDTAYDLAVCQSADAWFSIPDAQAYA